MNKSFFLLSLLSFVLVVSPFTSAAAEDRVLRLGIMSFEGSTGFTTHIKEEDKILSEIAQKLQTHLPNLKIQTRFYRMNDLMKAIAKKEVDIFLGSSGLFWQMKQYGVRDIASIVSSTAPNPNKGVAGVIFTRKDRTDINNLEDARGKVASAGLENMFLAYQLGFATIAGKGHDPERFFSKIYHHDLPVLETVKQVRSGEADVGVLRACILESEFPDWQNYFKILNEQKDPEFKCAHSTDLYPNWTMAATSGLDPEVIKQLTQTLLNLPPDGEKQLAWSLVTDFEKVNQVARLLKTDAYSHLKEWTIKRVWEEHNTLIICALLGLIAFLFHVWRVENLVAKRTQALSDEIKRRVTAEKDAREIGNRLMLAHKLNIVSQLSTLFAHELKQPLAVTQYSTDSMKILLGQEHPDLKKLSKCRKSIEAQTEKMTSIIDRVRSYTKSSQKRDRVFSLAPIVKNAVVRKRKYAEIKLELPQEDLKIMGEELEIELLLENLLNNSINASPKDEPIQVSFRKEKNDCLLTISNGGKKLSEAEIKKLCQPLTTSQPSGLGLGISIIESISEAHHAKVSFLPNPQGGLTVKIAFPPVESNRNA